MADRTGHLVRIEGLQSAREHNGKLARVLSGALARSATEVHSHAAAPERVPVQLIDGARARLCVRPANLHRAYEPHPFELVCRGTAGDALARILDGFADGAVAYVHYVRQATTSFGAPTIFRGAFDFGRDGCATMDATTIARATSDHTALHVKIAGVPDAVELVLVADRAGDDTAGEQLWYDAGVPRELWRVPVDADARNAALDGREAQALAFQRGVSGHFGQPGVGDDHPSYAAFLQAMAVLVAGCSCPNGHERPGTAV
ncbi:hypothetical protein KFE25_002438 [Diacronema lutheri]|uniref:Uncharacterized protein n=1 Tax=Diacronema lutheri TaxID=2081491 RepID=A0A8J5XBS2_DIALT|nr:hypothetical protein KFE25_002438 [Diacronema lutheri]|mmetsp:Transcript_18467/g.57534  ORF Transcript_18467/g.57534 Transcript_18467/m.57534 type:complete len:260 (-) Transcript_18467:42-821(-)